MTFKMEYKIKSLIYNYTTIKECGSANETDLSLIRGLGLETKKKVLHK